MNVEGQTEERFVNLVLAPFLWEKGFHDVSARLLGNPRNQSRGGVCGWQGARRDLIRRAKEDSALVQTLMVDYYAMPSAGPAAWPGRSDAVGETASQKAAYVEARILKDLSSELSSDPGCGTVIPYVSIHEFESLLFSDTALLASSLRVPDLASRFQGIRDGFPTPEDINDSPHTAPSKRIQTLVPGYQKVLNGVDCAIEIGLARMRAECPHFHSWLERLEALAGIGVRRTS